MLLFSVTFFVFLVIAAVIYFIIPKKIQWCWLLIASYVFYAWADVKIAVFLLFATLCTYSVGLWLQKLNDTYAKRLKDAAAMNQTVDKKELKKQFVHKKRLALALGIVLIFAMLGIVKYANFVIGNINSVFASGGSDFTLGFIDIILPIGISFYTFQSAGYLIDVYRGKVKADRNVFKYALFVSYFPQIVQGPIGRYRDLAQQLYEPHAFEYTRVKFGIQRMLWGFFKKMVIADRIAVVVNTVFDNFYINEYEGLTVFIGVLLYGIQIYADFSGGMDIVCGISQVFGINLAENFKRPFMAKSVSEFWQRWHITLGGWMRDYLFYPLALSRPFAKMSKALRKFGSTYAAKVIPTCLASFIVFVLIGIWHGASWKYVAYGLYSATFVSTATLFEPFYAKCRKLFCVKPERFSFRLFQILRTVFLITVGRYFSRAISFLAAVNMMKATVSTWNPWVLFNNSLYELGLDQKNFQFMILLIVLLFVIDFLQEKGYKLREAIARQGIVFRWALYIAVIIGIIVFGMYGPEYDAANFIYQGF